MIYQCLPSTSATRRTGQTAGRGLWDTSVFSRLCFSLSHPHLPSPFILSSSLSSPPLLIIISFSSCSPFSPLLSPIPTVYSLSVNNHHLVKQLSVYSLRSGRMASLPPRPSHPAPSEDSNRPLGPFFFTFRPSAVGSPVTVPGFFVPLQWPPPNAALTQPRGGSSFVFTDFSNDALPRPHPVWNAGNLPTQPPSQPRPPRPQPSRSSSHHSQPPGSSSFATWSAGQPGVTLIVSVNTGGHVDVSVPPSSTVRTAVPTASSSSGEHGTAPTTTASRSTQTSSTVTQETLTAPAKEVKTSPTHPGSRTRPSLPTDWISPQKGAKAHPSRRGSKSVSQKEVSEVEANLAESRTPSDVAGNEQAKQPSGRK